MVVVVEIVVAAGVDVNVDVNEGGGRSRIQKYIVLATYLNDQISPERNSCPR